MVKNNQPIIIAGPCAIENKNQFASTIQNIYNNVDIVRCGVWKGRTSPKSYPGKGTPSLTWIKEAQKKYKTPFAIEIGTVNHIQLALENDIKMSKEILKSAKLSTRKLRFLILQSSYCRKNIS